LWISNEADGTGQPLHRGRRRLPVPASCSTAMTMTEGAAAQSCPVRRIGGTPSASSARERQRFGVAPVDAVAAHQRARRRLELRLISLGWTVKPVGVGEQLLVERAISVSAVDRGVDPRPSRLGIGPVPTRPASAPSDDLNDRAAVSTKRW
jgi:hypothetical protein